MRATEPEDVDDLDGAGVGFRRLRRLHDLELAFGVEARLCARTRNHRHGQDQKQGLHVLHGRSPRNQRIAIEVITVIRLGPGRPVKFPPADRLGHNGTPEAGARG